MKGPLRLLRRRAAFGALELLELQKQNLRRHIARRWGVDGLRAADRLAELAVKAKEFDHQAERELIAGKWN